MADLQEIASKLFSSEENRDSIDASNAEAGGRDEEFYEEIEAPKFVDFTRPDHYRPDDRYWFCLRVGCDQKHLEEIDSETCYKNFVRRVMAARSPNVRLRKALDRNASRTSIKCPHSAPPKSSRPRLSKLANISSISEKTLENKKTVARPLLKPGSTPLIKSKPVAAKYLTTPRNTKIQPNKTSFLSVQNPKAANVNDVSKSVVKKTLVFHSPKKTIKVKTSVELRTPVTKLCEGMKRLEISSQRSKSARNLKNGTSDKGRSRPEKPVCSQTSSNNEARFVKSSNTKVVRGKLLKKNTSEKSLGVDRVDSLKTKEDDGIKQELIAPKVAEGLEVEESDLASADGLEGEGKLSQLEGSNILRYQTTSTEETRSNGENEINGRVKYVPERDHNSFTDSDDKENVTASDENRMNNSNQKLNGRKIFGSRHDKCGEVKKIAQTADKHLKEGSNSSCLVTKLKKPKPTNPKPFRLRTDERGILKEAKLEKRDKPQASLSENTNWSSQGGKLQRKQGTDIQKKVPNVQDKSRKADSLTAQNNLSHIHQEPKTPKSRHGSNAIQRLEKFRRTASPVHNRSVQPQGFVPTKKELISYLIPGRKLDVIHETSPEIRKVDSLSSP